MQFYDYIIISQNKQDNFRLCTILHYTLQIFVAGIATKHYHRTSQLTPQAKKN